MQFFHHYSIRRYTAAILDTFNDMHIVRFKDDGTVDRDVTIPITFATKQKAFEMTSDDFTKFREQKYNVLPRLSLSFDGLTKSPERETNKLNKTMKFNDDRQTMTYTYNSVSYSFDFTIYILTDSFTELTMLIEQIVPMFNPTYSIMIKDMDFLNDYRSVPLRLNDITTDLDMDLGMDDDIRLCNATLTFSIDANLYPPIKDGKIVNHVITNLYDDISKIIPKGEL
jgi:hypothetical protein